MKTPYIKLINRSPLRLGLFLTALALACFALSPTARAVCQDACLAESNTVQGDDALISLTTGIFNTATGAFALSSNTTGNNNTANGLSALSENTTGSNNTATGLQALVFNATGENNTATGVNALYSSVNNGSFNTATGVNALFSNASFNNTATGFDALLSNTTGNSNTATGVSALFRNTTGNNNNAIGISALSNNTTGSSNIALGDSAGINLTTGSNNIDIGNKGVAGEANTIRIGKSGTQTTTVIAGITGATVAGGVGVIIGSNGKLGTVVSSGRFKDHIKPMDKASEAILSLKPVTFRYKHELDPDGIPQFGLVAEQVEKVNPDLVARDDQGKPYPVRYEAVNAMLLNEFLKEHRKGEQQDRKIEEQNGKQQKLEATVAQQQREIQALTAALKEQAAQIQKVSEQVRTQASAPRVVAND